MPVKEKPTTPTSQDAGSHRRQPRRLFVTGTDTGVGKTFVAAALILGLRRSGHTVVPMKPLESGCRMVDGQLFPEDAMRLHLAAGGDPNDDDALAKVCPYRLAAPLAPAVAAEKEGIRIDERTILEAADALQREAGPDSILVIEGAGGLLVPAYPGRCMADLARLLGARLLIVARSSLGTVNHTLLTLEAARHRDLEIAGIVLNDYPRPAAEDASLPYNEATIETLGGAPVLGHLPYVESAANGEIDWTKTALDSCLAAAVEAVARL
ncbi:MAG: dethiobiotin synthase [Myxococcales bacterium]|nr:MAG: dethiobiotin synthase [Myxococcales bacterium]